MQQHPGLLARERRLLAGITMTEVAYRIRADLGRMSKFEKGLCNLTLEQQSRLDALLGRAIREKRAELDEFLRECDGQAVAV